MTENPNDQIGQVVDDEHMQVGINTDEDVEDGDDASNDEAIKGGELPDVEDEDDDDEEDDDDDDDDDDSEESASEDGEDSEDDDL